MKKLLVCFLIISTGIFFGVSGCGDGDNDDPVTPAIYSILGTWAYAMIMGNNTTTWDNGTITFTGTDTSGTYTKTDFYGTTSTGNYTVNGVNVTITEENQNWTGTFSDAANMSGTWNSTTGLDSGTWTATKQ